MIRRTTRALDCGCEYSNFSFAEAQTATQKLRRKTKKRPAKNFPPKGGVNPPKGGELFLHSVEKVILDIAAPYRIVLVAEKGGNQHGETPSNSPGAEASRTALCALP